MKKIIILVLAFMLFASQVMALELVRQKNVATYIMFPIMKNDGTLITGATGLDSELNYFGDANAPQASFTDCTNEATEIGTTGQYYLSITQAEMNHDYIIIQCKSSSTGAITQTMLIRTTVGAPTNIATTDDGGTINVTGGAVDTVTTLTNKTGFALSQTFPTNFADLAITASTGRVTVGTNADKAGYSISGTKTTLDSLNDITAASVWSVATRLLTAGTNIVLAKGTGITGFNDISAQNVWDYNISGYSTAGYAGTYLKNAGGGSSPSDIADAVWDEALSGHLTAGTTGKKLNDSPTPYDVGP